MLKNAGRSKRSATVSAATTSRSPKARVGSCETPETAKTRLLADWWAAARDDLPGNVMIVLRRRDVAELNALARTLMESHGRLGRDRVSIAGSEFASGDRIVCLRNSEALA